MTKRSAIFLAALTALMAEVTVLEFSDSDTVS